MNSSDSPLFEAIIRIDRLPTAGRDLNVSLDADTRAAVAEALQLTSIEAFDAKMTIVPLRGGIRAQGRLVARITQPSVVTFEPVTQDIDEPIDRVFLPEAQARNPTPGSEVFVDIDDEDFPDHIDGPEVDLSVLLTETLALAIDPYPRLPGESLDALDVNQDGEESGPFAGLARLRNPDDSGR